MPEAHERAFEALAAAHSRRDPLYRGAEVMLDRPLDARCGRATGGLRSTAPGTSWWSSPGWWRPRRWSRRWRWWSAIGLVPLVAHPERYRCCHAGPGPAVEVAGGADAGGRADAAFSPAAGSAGPASWSSTGWRTSPPPTTMATSARSGRSGTSCWPRTGGMQAELLLTQNPLAIFRTGWSRRCRRSGWRVSISDRLRALFGRGARRGSAMIAWRARRC